MHDYMASNCWAIYMIILKAKFDIEKSFNGDTSNSVFVLTDHSFYKNLSGFVTLLFLLPLIYKMALNINSKNFCNYLALVNFVAFNFGYHVHEKAM